MITVDFYQAIGIFFLILIVGFLSVWVITRRRRETGVTDHLHIWHCSICAHTYSKRRKEVITVCPKCGSYNKK